jgi:hypothetical protein
MKLIIKVLFNVPFKAILVDILFFASTFTRSDDLEIPFVIITKSTKIRSDLLS